ncbi:MAG: FtsX-like permease family protein [Ideonella sp.]|nr:FtsX-like permease family protein [Ideonella sp.]
MGALLFALSWPELRLHPWRNATALLAVVLGVALAFAVQLINASALAEFGAAVRSVNGEPDFELRAAWRGAEGGFDETLYARVAAHPQVAIASPVVEVDTYAIGADGRRVALRVLGLDLFVAAPLAPGLLPRAFDTEARLALLDPGALFPNPAARQALGLESDAPGRALALLAGSRTRTLRVAGSVAAPGPPLAVMDIAGAQAEFGRVGRLSRIDVRLAAGADRDAVLAGLALPPGVRAAEPDEAQQRLSNVSRAYRVNLTVLALVALFTGAFLVFSVLALAVARRQPQFALLGVLGMPARDRLRLVVAESALLGLVGSVLGVALGSALAALALRWLSGDLGGGFFAQGAAPPLQFSVAAALVYGALGVLAAVAGGWLPARAAQQIAPAQAIKGLAASSNEALQRPWLAPVLLAAGGLLALCPPVFGLPLAAYLSVGCVLLGGIACVPAVVSLLLRAVAPPQSALPLLAVERARRQRQSATIAVAGVVASLALSVALTVMVASFRDSMTRWLDTVLPADLYVRAAASVAAGDSVFLAPEFVQAVAQLPGVARVATQRVTQVQLAPDRPAVVLLARPLADPARALPLVGELLPAEPGRISAYVSEPMASLYGAAPGTRLQLPLPDGRIAALQVRGVWRDYARQGGAIVLDAADYRRLTGDERVNDLALWLAPGADPAAVQAGIEAAAGTTPVELAAAGEIRAVSLRIFDRSFAVTYWLQAVAIAIGLFGIAASFSAQVLARRKEFALLTHLGLTRRQIVAVVAAEGALWTAAGTLLGLALGLAVSVVLVEVVNPQSFHWSMDLALPVARLAALCAAVVAAGSATAWFAARALARQDMALAVKEDW